MNVAPPNDLKNLVYFFINLINPLLVLLMGLSLLVFFWGLTKFIFKAGDEKSHTEGKNLMKWGLIALFLMVSVFGILRFAFSDFFGGPFGVPQLPV